MLCVHGNAGSGALWARVAAGLAPGLRADRPDLPGFGRAAAAPTPADLASFVAGVVAAARALPVPVTLVGNGIGSVLCGHAARTLGDAARGVVMTGPVGVAGGHSALGALARRPAGARLLRIVGRTVGRGVFLGDQLADPGADPEAARILLDALRDARGFDALARLNVEASLEGLRGLRCPVTVLWGDRDGVLPVTCAERFLGRLPAHARLVVVPGAGHALPLERPDVVVRAVLDLE